jgi:hypothetical protein
MPQQKNDYERTMPIRRSDLTSLGMSELERSLMHPNYPQPMSHHQHAILNYDPSAFVGTTSTCAFVGTPVKGYYDEITREYLSPVDILEKASRSKPKIHRGIGTIEPVPMPDITLFSVLLGDDEF